MYIHTNIQLCILCDITEKKEFHESSQSIIDSCCLFGNSNPVLRKCVGEDQLLTQAYSSKVEKQYSTKTVVIFGAMKD